MSLRRSSSGGNLATLGTNGDADTPGRPHSPNNRSSLSSFLSLSPSRSKKSSATVAGDRNVVSMASSTGGGDDNAESEIYIRADGKKVRRVKRTVIRKKPAATESTTSDTNTASPAAVESHAGLVTSGGAAAAAKDSKSAASSVDGGGRGAVLGETEEIYTRPDGKKVRRIKKTISKRSLNATGGEENGATAAGADGKPSSLSTMKDGDKNASTLSGFLNSNSSPDTVNNRRFAGGSATVAGDRVRSEESEIITRPDGKKVRRIKKTVVRTKSAELKREDLAALGLTDSTTAAATTTTPKSMASAAASAPVSPKRSKKGLLDSFVASNSPKRTSSKSGSATVAAGTGDGEIYINAAGKRVRRVRKPKSLSGSGSVSGESVSTEGGGGVPSPPPLHQEGEIYIRPDGTKVRRVKKSSAGATTSTTSSNDSSYHTPSQQQASPASSAGKSLSGFLDQGTPKNTAASRKSGSATVAGDRVTEEVGEIIIRADGKKVRRIKRTVLRTTSSDMNSLASAASSLKSPPPSSSPLQEEQGGGTTAKTTTRPSSSPDEERKPLATAAEEVTPAPIVTPPPPPPPPAEAAPPPATGELEATAKSPPKWPPTPTKESLGSFLDKHDVPRPQKSGSATVTGAPMKPEGEIYINADGKRVRRVKKSALAAATAKVQQEAAASTSPASNSGDLAAMLESPRSKKKTVSSATVAGDFPTKHQQGEIYIRADGKKVRRVKKSSLGLGEHLDGASVDGTAKPPGDAATVTGDRVVKVTDEGEIVIRADGKKVLRRKKKDADKSPSAASASVEQGEVYRRADGKLVRRVKRTTTGDLAGFLDENKTTNKTGDSATVFGDQVSKRRDGGALSDLLAAKPKEESSSVGDRPTTPTTAPMSDASGHQKDTSSEVATIPKAQSPQEASKAVTSSIPAETAQEAVIPAPTPELAILAPSSVSASAAPTHAVPVSYVQLSEDDEAIAQFYRKKLKMGMPLDAVRHKMIQDGVDAKIIAAVVGSDGSELPLAPPPVATSVPSIGVQLTEDEEAIAQFYRKKLKMGMPSDAVRHKMVAEGVDAKVIATVMGEGEAPAAPAPALPVSNGTAAPAPAVIQLSEDEEALAQFYRKKLKMGMPLDAVLHKMTQDGVDAKVIAAVVGGDAPAPAVPAYSAPSTLSSVPLSEDEEAIAQFYRKKLKMGMPPDAVRHKMAQDGVDAKIVAAVVGGGDGAATSTPAPATTPPHGSDLTVEERYLVESYLKMTKMGMPVDAVKHKMTQDGVDAKLILHVLNAVGAAPASPSTPLVTPATATNSVAYIVVVSEDDTPHPNPADGPVHTPISDSELEAIAHDEKFAVKVEENSAEQPGTSSEAETKFMTLDQIAKLTGQSKDELAAMVAQKRQKQEAVPRFVLQPLSRQESLYEVAVPTSPDGIKSSVSIPLGSNMAPIKEGQEVVDSALASAARAVSALGDGDMSKLLAQLQAGDIGELVAKLQEAEKRQKKLEKQLAQAGVAIAEDIEYGEAKDMVHQIAKRMNEIGGSDVVLADKGEQNRLREEYFKLEQEMERYNAALMLTEEYQAEQDRLEKKWEADNEPGNIEAIKKIRRHMPVKIRHMSEADLTNNPSPNGKFLPKAIAKKFKRTNVLQLLRINPDDIERMHPSTLENMRVTGLTLTERRALYLHLKPIGPKWQRNKAEKMTERKWTWYTMMKNNFKENLAPWVRHVEQYGPPENHVGCPLLGKQCPIKADLILDYNNDYGYTDEAEYEVSEVRKADTDDPGAKAMQEALELAREKKANERADMLKKHYKGKLLQVSKANGSCEAMDECMDKMESHIMKWLELVVTKGDNPSEEDDKKKEVASFTDALNELKLLVLDFAQRSGMQTSGKKKAGDGAEDPRSSVEAALSEEVYEGSLEFFKFIKDRMKTNVKDTRVEKTIELLEGMMNELHTRNVNTISRIGGKRPDKSRKIKKISDLRREVEEKLKPKEEEMPSEEVPSPMGLPPRAGGRGDLLSALQGRGRGGGRGDLLSALSGRGRGRGGGGDDGGRGGMLAAIQGRGKGPPGGGDGGRGGLMAAIQGRGTGQGGGDAGGSRGGLLAAIQARGGGGG